MKVTKSDIETMEYLRGKGFTQQSIADLFKCHRTLVEYYTTPGRMEYVRNYSRGRVYKSKISKMNPVDVAKIFN